MSETLGHACHTACPCNNTEEVITVEATTPLPPPVIWCTTCGGPCRGGH